MGADDVINLGNITRADIDTSNPIRKLNRDDITIKFKDGAALTVETKTDINLSLDDGTMLHSNDLVDEASKPDSYVEMKGADGVSTVFAADDKTDATAIWCKGVEGSDYLAAKTVDAKNFKSPVLIEGNALENIITASDYNASLWGGEGSENDTLIGGNGTDQFFYVKTNGNDVIENAGDNDVINLLGIDLTDISSVDVNTASISIGFNDGGSIKVNSSADFTFRLIKDQIDQKWHAVNRDPSNVNWEARS